MKLAFWHIEKPTSARAMIEHISGISPTLNKQSQKNWVKNFLAEFFQKWTTLETMRNLLTESVITSFLDHKVKSKNFEEIFVIFDFITLNIGASMTGRSYLILLLDTVCNYVKKCITEKTIKSEAIKRYFDELLKVPIFVKLDICGIIREVRN